MRKIQLGLIGTSEENGHPYSWSAIINGYDKKKIKKCGFPIIPKYLNKKNYPKDFIKNAQVSHIWTQDVKISRKIASTTFIPNIVTKKENLIGKVDGVLIARDDYKNHYKISKPFLKAGLPVYIDKPISISLKNFEKIYNNEIYPGQIFTCSATRYSKSLSLPLLIKKKIGVIKKIIATSPKNWDKYSVHIIEPVVKMLFKKDVPLKFEKSKVNKNNLVVTWSSNIQTVFVMKKNKKSQIKILIKGSKGKKTLYFDDTFESFKLALKDFIFGIKKKSIQSPKRHNYKIVKIIEQGIKLNV